MLLVGHEFHLLFVGEANNGGKIWIGSAACAPLARTGQMNHRAHASVQFVPLSKSDQKLWYNVFRTRLLKSSAEDKPLLAL